MNIAIIVLGQSLNTDGSAPATLLSRVEQAKAEKLRHANAIVIASGGDPAETGTSEARVMQNFLGEACVLEEESQDTLQNAYYCTKLLAKHGVTQVILVTSDFHMPRSSYLFEAVFRMQNVTNSLEQSKAPARTPNENDTGVNARTLGERLKLEHRLLSKFEGKPLLPYKLDGKYVPALPASRLEAAFNQLREVRQGGTQ